MKDSIIDRLRAGDPGALSLAISQVLRAKPGFRDLLGAIQPHLGRALVVGLTGAPGAGKSTLSSALVGALRGHGLTVGVIAVDPASQATGGALLGDRLRLNQHAGDDGVFVRSLSAAGAGGLSAEVSPVIDLMDAAGRDVVLVETVGAGQGDTGIAELADISLLVVTPGMGDAIQAAKAGMLEHAQIIVVNKADLPEAATAAAQLTHAARGEVILVSARSGMGIDALMQRLLALGEARDPAARTQRRVAHLGRTLLEAAALRLGADREQLASLATRVRRGELTTDEAVDLLLDPFRT